MSHLKMFYKVKPASYPFLSENFATGFESAAYDYAFYWTIDPDEIAKGYSICFLVDEADFWENYS